MSGVALMLCADVAFAAMAAATKFAGHRLPASEIVFVRSFFSCLALVGILKNRKISLKANEPALLWARGIVGYIALQCYFWALPQITLGTAVMLNYTAPFFAVIFSFFTLREKPPLSVKLLLLVSSLGIYLLSSPEISGHGPAVLAGLLSGLLAGSVYVMIRQSNKTDTPLLIIFYFTLSCTIGSALLILKTGWLAPTPMEWLGLLVITTSSLFGQIFLTFSLQRSPVWVVSPFGYLTPVIGLALGIIFWRETPNAANLTGSALVIICGIVMLKKTAVLKPRASR